MHILAPLLALSAGFFDAPDSSAWILQPEARSTGLTGLPGTDGFYTPPKGDATTNVATDAGGGAGGMQLRLNLRTPHRRNFAGILGIGVGRFYASWDNQVTIRTALGSKSYEAVLEHAATYLDLVAGVEWRPADRHALLLQLASPVQLGSGSLVYKVDGSVLYDGDAPGSFRMSAAPRVMAGYEYRLFDRIALGIDLSVVGVDGYARTPTFTAEGGDVRTLSDKAIGNTWMELHAGWAFSL